MKVSYVVVIIESCTKRKVYGINSMKVEGVPLISFSSNSKHRYHHAFFVLFFLCCFFPDSYRKKNHFSIKFEVPFGIRKYNKDHFFHNESVPNLHFLQQSRHWTYVCAVDHKNCVLCWNYVCVDQVLKLGWQLYYGIANNS